MGKTKPTGKSNSSGRDSGGFVALPWSVIDCPAYDLLSMHARALLIELARQYVRDNNGRLLLSMAYMRKRGWKSASMLAKAKKELLEGGFIFEMVKGHRPNKASWYAVTWHSLDKLKGFDEGAEKCFIRSAYSLKAPYQIKPLIPKVGVRPLIIAPKKGLETNVAGPEVGLVKSDLSASPSPHSGNHLDMPSTSINVDQTRIHSIAEN